MIERFQDDHAGPLAEHEAAALRIEGPAGRGGIFVLRRKRGQAIKASHAEWMNHRMRAAADHHLRVSAAKDIRGFADRLRGGGTGGQTIHCRPASPGEQRQVRERHVRLLLQLASRVHHFAGQMRPFHRIKRAGGSVPRRKAARR